MRRSFGMLLAAGLLLAGCATGNAFREGQQLLSEGKVEDGLAQLQKAVDEDPGNVEYRVYLVRQRERVINQLLVQAEAARLNGQFDEAEAIYRRALRLLPGNQGALAGLEGLAADRRHKTRVAEAQKSLQKGDLDKAQLILRQVLAENPKHREARPLLRRVEEKQVRELTVSPKLKSTLAKPVTLEFRDASLKAVFEMISRTAGINFIFDKDVRPDLRASIFVRNTTIEDAIQVLLVANQLDKKILTENTILIYPNTAVKQREYRELVVRSFYLANADVKQTAGMIRAVLRTRDLFIDEKLNMLVIRDTPETVRLAEKLIAAQDLAEPEVMMEVEVLEVSRSRLQELGVRFPERVNFGEFTLGAVPPLLTEPNRSNLTAFVANPIFILNLKAQDAAADVLANPRIRVKNREKAKIHIGDKVPVITSTATATGFVSQSITYLDVGVKLDVEPVVGLEDEVTIKVGLEVSSIVKEVVTQSGTVAFQVGTRSAGTTLRLRDGETQVLAGLIQDEDRKAAAKVPGLGDLPVLGRLFSSHSDTAAKTEIVLLITPRVVKNLALPEAGVTEFPAGTESGLSGGRFAVRPGEPLPPLAPPVPFVPVPKAPLTPPAPAPRVLPTPLAPAPLVR